MKDESLLIKLKNNITNTYTDKCFYKKVLEMMGKINSESWHESYH